MHILGEVFNQQYSWAYWLIAVSINVLFCFGCWWLAKEAGRNEAWAIVAGLMCGLWAFLVYLFLWAKDTGGRARRKPQSYYTDYPRTYTDPPPYSPDPYYTSAPDDTYITPVVVDPPFSYDSAGAGGYCTRCGNAQELGAQFCPHCGERVSVTGPVMPAGPPAQPDTGDQPQHPSPASGPTQPPALNPPAPGAQPPPPPPAAEPPKQQGGSKPSQWK
jgi:zinc-ribbon domain